MKELELFEAKAKEELAALREELSKKEKERDIASASSEAAHRHLDNFAASMKSIEPDIAGGADPRLRILEQEGTRNSNVVAKQPPVPAPKTGSRPTPGIKAAPKPKAQVSRSSAEATAAAAAAKTAAK